tara:strand:- start:34 stop:597 length:564 start_codon:yes stop_codon:yes gene_type:complete
MRIISGNFRGKKILQPKDNFTRPLKDLTKESIFNVILHSNKFNITIEKSNILDLFSGVGSFGLECLSRGAVSLTFIENYKKVLVVLKKNIFNLNYQAITSIIESDIFEPLALKSLNKKYDIIFIDPPYKERRLSLLLLRIKELKLINENGIIIIHRHKKEINQFPHDFNVIDEKNYGISKIIFGNWF